MRSIVSSNSASAPGSPSACVAGPRALRPYAAPPSALTSASDAPPASDRVGGLAEVRLASPSPPTAWSRGDAHCSRQPAFMTRGPRSPLPADPEPSVDRCSPGGASPPDPSSPPDSLPPASPPDPPLPGAPPLSPSSSSPSSSSSSPSSPSPGSSRSSCLSALSASLASFFASLSCLGPWAFFSEGFPGACARAAGLAAASATTRKRRRTASRVPMTPCSRRRPDHQDPTAAQGKRPVSPLRRSGRRGLLRARSRRDGDRPVPSLGLGECLCASDAS